jgi:hypothetical protein
MAEAADILTERLKDAHDAGVRKPVVHLNRADGDNHDNLPVSCLTWGFPYDCPAKMHGGGALYATPFTYPSKGAALPVG